MLKWEESVKPKKSLVKSEKLKMDLLRLNGKRPNLKLVEKQFLKHLNINTHNNNNLLC